ncbi:hypothetical protein ACFXO7_13015 [Nocardia tengchongensis]|uniref:hypothetical protein n=1 Tax=Nocardia tengchongensis TaxID=2055889 RepID=UPI00368C72B4
MFEDREAGNSHNGPELASALLAHGERVADSAREHGPELVAALKDRSERLAEAARQHGTRLADATRAAWAPPSSE